MQTELLVQVGAPQQAGERVLGKFFELVEWFERHILGWTLPGDKEIEDSTSKVGRPETNGAGCREQLCSSLRARCPCTPDTSQPPAQVYEVLQNYTPVEAAYSFAQLKCVAAAAAPASP